MEINEKHLEFLQNNIARMNQCSFKMKGWAITLVSAFLALYVSTIQYSPNKIFIAIAIIPTIMFWLLDAYYLSMERKFIAMYNECIGLLNKKDRVGLRKYEISPQKYDYYKYSIFKTFFSMSQIIYIVMLIGLILLTIHL